MKASVVAAVGRAVAAPADIARFVPGHPMGGSERSGPEHASAHVIDGIVWALAPTEATAGPSLDRVTGFVRSLGAHPITLTPDRHDRLVAVVSHLPQVASTALMALAAREETDEPDLLVLAAGGFRDLTRLAASNPVLWGEILSANGPEVVQAIDLYVAGLLELRDAIGAERRADIERSFASAKAARVGLAAKPQVRAGVAIVVVEIPDEPGALARIDRDHERGRREHRGSPDRPLGRGGTGAGAAHRRGDHGGRGHERAHLGGLRPHPVGVSAMDLTITPGSPVTGRAEVPGDKSIAHRWLMFAATADGTSHLANLPLSLDVRSTARVMASLAPMARPVLEVWSSNDPPTIEGGGSTWNGWDRDAAMSPIEVEGEGRAGLRPPGSPLSCGNSGTTMRLLAGLVAPAPFETVLVGDASLSSRPMERVAAPLRVDGGGGLDRVGARARSRSPAVRSAASSTPRPRPAPR